MVLINLKRMLFVSLTAALFSISYSCSEVADSNKRSVKEDKPATDSKQKLTAPLVTDEEEAACPEENTDLFATKGSSKCTLSRCPVDPCDSARRACAYDHVFGTISTVGNALDVFGGCLAILQIGLNSPLYIDLVNKFRSGNLTWKEMADLAGEHVCDFGSCVSAIAPPLRLAVVGACSCYRGIKGALNCSIAMSQCEMEHAIMPVIDPDVGLCSRSSVNACYRDRNGNMRPEDDVRISEQCQDLALRLRYSGDQFTECVTNCINLTNEARENCGSTGFEPSPF